MQVAKLFSTLPINPSIVNGLCSSMKSFLEYSPGSFGSSVVPVMNIDRTRGADS